MRPINLNDEHDLAVYCTDNYSSAHNAAQFGAMYSTSSSVTGYGMTSLLDSLELIEAASACMNGNRKSLVLCIYHEGEYRELTHEMIDEGIS